AAERRGVPRGILRDGRISAGLPPALPESARERDRDFHARRRAAPDRARQARHGDRRQGKGVRPAAGCRRPHRRAHGHHDPTASRKRKEEFERSLFRLFRQPDHFEVQALEPRIVEGATYSAALVKSDVVRDWIVFFDADGRLARMEYSGEGPQGPAKMTEV